jgi:virulence-associated protein VagC
MKARVTEEGVVIPKKFLNGVSEVEIRLEGSVIIVIPKYKEDTIFKMGSNPVPCNISDASQNLDKYLY